MAIAIQESLFLESKTFTNFDFKTLQKIFTENALISNTFSQTVKESSNGGPELETFKKI
jgi:hypothetical protein